MTVRFDEKGKYFTEYVTKEAVLVLIQTPLQRIQGRVHIQPKERLKDALNHAKPFLALTDVTVFDLNGVVQCQSGFLALNKDQIHWMIPLEDVATDAPPGEG
jgi:hypothetical protein